MKLSGAIYNGKTEIKNVIFDWGGVITDLHFDVAKAAFASLGLSIFNESVPHDPNDNLFIPFEIGTMPAAQFRERVKKLTVQHITDEMIDYAWNSLLGELPADRLEIVKKTAAQYRTFLLSNTNAIHVPYYFNYIKKTYHIQGYNEIFEKVYYSYELGMRKPNEDIFKFVLEDAGIKPEETIFIDDFLENIETARLMGFQTVHLKAPLTLKDVFVK